MPYTDASLRIFTLSLLGLIAGCGADAPAGMAGTCTDRTDCAADEICRDSRCVAAPDAGTDASTPDDAGTLATFDAAPAVDAATADFGGAFDLGGELDAGPTDSGMGIDAPMGNACVRAGGTCVPTRVLDPCPDGVIGDRATYSCGTLLRLGCCLPM